MLEKCFVYSQTPVSKKSAKHNDNEKMINFGFLNNLNIEEIKKLATTSGFGYGEETLFDQNIRKSTEIDLSDKFLYLKYPTTKDETDYYLLYEKYSFIIKKMVVMRNLWISQFVECAFDN